MVRPRIAPSKASLRIAFISAGSFQLLVKPASSSFSEQINVRDSTRQHQRDQRRPHKNSETVGPSDEPVSQHRPFPVRCGRILPASRQPSRPSPVGSAPQFLWPNPITVCNWWVRCPQPVQPDLRRRFQPCGSFFVSTYQPQHDNTSTSSCREPFRSERESMSHTLAACFSGLVQMIHRNFTYGESCLLA